MSKSTFFGDSEWVVVSRVAGLLQADILKGRLETADIPVLLDYESVGRVYGLIVDGLGEVRVMVPAQYARDAQVLLAGDVSDGEIPPVMDGD